MTSQISETTFKDRVLRDLRTFGDIWIIKTQERARRGIPDIIFCYHGFFVAIELKKDGKFPDRLQQVVLDNIVKAGGMAFWTTPSSWGMHLSILRDYFANEK